MSESSPETTTRSTGSPFLRKMGPLPLWGWMGVVLAVVLVYYFWKQKQNASTAASTDTGSSSSGGTGGVDVSGQIPQFVNQTYTTVTPPAAPTVTPAAPTVPATVAPPTPAPAAVKSPLPVTVVPPKSMDNSYTEYSTTRTIAQLGSSLHLTNPSVALIPTNPVAQTFMKSTYPKNHNAKIPKGAKFDYVTGT